MPSCKINPYESNCASNPKHPPSHNAPRCQCVSQPISSNSTKLLYPSKTRILKKPKEKDEKCIKTLVSVCRGKRGPKRERERKTRKRQKIKKNLREGKLDRVR